MSLTSQFRAKLQQYKRSRWSACDVLSNVMTQELAHNAPPDDLGNVVCIM